MYPTEKAERAGRPPGAEVPPPPPRPRDFPVNRFLKEYLVTWIFLMISQVACDSFPVICQRERESNLVASSHLGNLLFCFMHL